MRVYGVDFTSAPSARKPITVALGELRRQRLSIAQIETCENFESFEELVKSGNWIAGLDFPFGQSRRFVENADWPLDWAGYVRHVSQMNRAEFRDCLEQYRVARDVGDKHHKRLVDVLARSQSPQTLDYTPAGLMFFEGAPRLLNSGATIAHLMKGDPNRVVVEAYPALIARRAIGSHSYKSDASKRQSQQQLEARLSIMRWCQDNLPSVYGFSLVHDCDLATDASGDTLDAVLCAIQAAWAGLNGREHYPAPSVDPLEGWIADPSLLDADRTPPKE